MVYWQRLSVSLPVLVTAAILTACGGGGDSDKPPANDNHISPEAFSVGAPEATGNMATDGLAWFNFRRQQLGLQAMTRNPALDKAANGHSIYQSVNDVITHDQVKGQQRFTGVSLADRLQQAGYDFTRDAYSYGEVISATGNDSGFLAAQDLVAAIYHRFVIFEPRFTEAGAGFAQRPESYIYFTTNFAANGLGRGLGKGGVVMYPFNEQKGVPRIFYSDREIPDPVPDRNGVGYPISVHADITSKVEVQSFTVQPRGGAPLAARLLSHPNDKNTPAAAAALVPLEVLTPNTTYDVRFAGTVDGVAVDRNWSFSTR